MTVTAAIPSPLPQAAAAPERGDIGWAMAQVRAGRRVRLSTRPRVIWLLDADGLLVEIVTGTKLRAIVRAGPDELLATDYEVAE